MQMFVFRTSGGLIRSQERRFELAKEITDFAQLYSSTIYIMIVSLYLWSSLLKSDTIDLLKEALTSLKKILLSSIKNLVFT